MWYESHFLYAFIVGIYLYAEEVHEQLCCKLVKGLMKLRLCPFRSDLPFRIKRTSLTQTQTPCENDALLNSPSLLTKKKKKTTKSSAFPRSSSSPRTACPRGDQAVVRDWSPSCGPTKFESPDQLPPYTHAVGNCPSRPLLVLCGPSRMKFGTEIKQERIILWALKK